MEKKKLTHHFIEVAIYELAYRKGFKNHTECVLHYGLYEYKRQRDKFFTKFIPEYEKTYQQSAYVNNNYIKVSQRKSKSPRCTRAEQVEKLTIGVEKLLSTLHENPTMSISILSEDIKISSKYVQTVINLGYLENIRSHRRPYWVVKSFPENYNELAEQLIHTASQKSNKPQYASVS